MTVHGRGSVLPTIGHDLVETIDGLPRAYGVNARGPLWGVRHLRVYTNGGTEPLGVFRERAPGLYIVDFFAWCRRGNAPIKVRADCRHHIAVVVIDCCSLSRWRELTVVMDTEGVPTSTAPWAIGCVGNAETAEHVCVTGMRSVGFFCGEPGGIRTHEGLASYRLKVGCLRPLGTRAQAQKARTRWGRATVCV